MDKLCHISAEHMNMRPNLCLGPIPPLDPLERSSDLFIEAMPEDVRRIACHNGIRRHIFRHDCSRLYHSPIANTDTAQNRRFAADPYVIPNDNLSA